MFDSDFPSKLFLDIKAEKQRFENSAIELENYMNEEENRFQHIVNDLTDERQRAALAAKEAADGCRAASSERLNAEKAQLLRQRAQVEREISDLQDFITRSDDAPKNAPLQKELILLKSIAPVQLVRADSDRIEGLIAFGTPESTEYFAYDLRGSPNAAPQFWRQLEKCRKNAPE